MKVYHFVNAVHGLDDLKHRRLKIATIDDLNDPFELLAVNLADRELRAAFLAVRKLLAVSRGILCFSRRWTNPVLWSHYSDGHRGLCLGFNIPDRHLTPVTCSSERLAIEAERLLNPQSMDEATALKFLTTKFSHWKYEAEMRCFLSLEDRDPGKDLYFVNFSNDLKLIEVIVGAASIISRQQIFDALGDLAPKIKVVKARLAFNTFNVVRQRNAFLWK